MEYRISEKYTVIIRQYESYLVEVTVGGTHRDVGVSDAELETLDDKNWESTWQSLKAFVDAEHASEVRSRLTRVAGWSDDPDNLATKVTGGSHAGNKASPASATSPRSHRR